MPSSVYLIFGGDDYLVSNKAKAIANALVPAGEQAMRLEIIDGRADTVDGAVCAMAKCVEALQTVGLFGAEKAVWFRDVNFLSDTVVGKSESVKSRVGCLAEMIKKGLHRETAFVVTSPKVDKRGVFYKACKSAGEVHEYDVPDNSSQAQKQARQTLQGILARAGLRMSQDVAAEFIEKVGADTRRIVSEIEKLSSFIGERRNVRSDDVKAVTSSSREAMAWDLADAVGRRDLETALKVLRKLMFQKESAIFLITSLGGRIRDLMVYREALDKGWLSEREGYRESISLGWGKVPDKVDTVFSVEFEKDPRATHPYRVGILAEQARRFSLRELAGCQEAIVEAHERLVSSSLPDGMILELLLFKMLA